MSDERSMADKLAEWFDRLPDGGMGKEHFDALLAIALPSHEHPIRDSQGGLSSTGERVATTTDTAELVAQYRAYIAACSGPGITLYDGHPAVLIAKARDAITALERERDEARAANKALMDERTNLIETKRQQLTASQAQVERLKALVETAFRDGLAYATNVVVTDADEAWRTSRIRAQVEESKG